MTAALSSITIDEALRDPNLLGAALGDPSSWSTWLSVLKAAFGQPLDTDEAAAFSAVAGGRASPLERVRELWAASVGAQAKAAWQPLWRSSRPPS